MTPVVNACISVGLFTVHQLNWSELPNEKRSCLGLLLHFLIPLFINVLVSGETIFKSKKLPQIIWRAYGVPLNPLAVGQGVLPPIQEPRSNSAFGLDFWPFGPHAATLRAMPTIGKR